jgi:hypothetical protein
MAKMIPRKKARVKREQEITELVDPRTQRKFEREMENALADYEEAIKKRHSYAQEIFKIQDETTKRAIRMLMNKMTDMAGPPTFRYKGQDVKADESLLAQLQQESFLWIAVRLLVACADWEIRIANFKLPTNKCMHCGERGRPV